MKNSCFLIRNAIDKDLKDILYLLTRKYKLPQRLDDIYVNFLTRYTGEVVIDLTSNELALTVVESEAISFFKKNGPYSLSGSFFKEPDGNVSHVCLIASVGDYHFPVYRFNSFESIIFQLITLMDSEEYLFQVAYTESDHRGLHMSIRNKDFGAIYYNQTAIDEPLPLGLHRVADNFFTLMNSLQLCIATSSSPYPWTIKEIGHCIE